MRRGEERDGRESKLKRMSVGESGLRSWPREKAVGQIQGQVGEKLGGEGKKLAVIY
jgi:hypothetical protein